MANKQVKEQDKILSSEFLDEIKRVREEKNISLDDISEKTNIKLNYVKAIESGDLDSLPGGVYNKAYIRSVSEYLGISTKLFERQVESEDLIDEKQIKVEFGSQFATKAPKFPILVACFASILIIYTLFYVVSGDQKNPDLRLSDAINTASDSDSHLEVQEDNTSPLKQIASEFQNKDFTISILAKEQTQVEITDAGDNVVLSKIFLPNEAIIYPADDKEYYLFTPEIGTIEVYLDGILVQNLVELEKQEDKILFTVDQLFNAIGNSNNLPETDDDTEKKDA